MRLTAPRSVFGLSCLLLAMTASCGQDPSEGAPEEAVLPAELSGRLFEGVDQEWERRLDQYHQAVARGEYGQTHKTDLIDWAPDIATAITRARQENKPIFLAHFVRQNGDPACDV